MTPSVFIKFIKDVWYKALYNIIFPFYMYSMMY